MTSRVGALNRDRKYAYSVLQRFSSSNTTFLLLYCTSSSSHNNPEVFLLASYFPYSSLALHRCLNLPIFLQTSGHPIYKNNIVWCDIQRRFAILKGGFLGSAHVCKSKSFVLLFMILRLFACDTI